MYKIIEIKIVVIMLCLNYFLLPVRQPELVSGSYNNLCDSEIEDSA